MGNLLGSPITEKETHSGSSADGSLHFGLSSMQGWRVHMEDAHICLLDVYAEEPAKNSSPNTTFTSDSNLTAQMRRSKYMKSSALHNMDPIMNSYSPKPSSMYQRIHLPNHSLFAVFDGHGGSFAADYAGLNFFRVLSRQASFVQYAQHIQSSKSDTDNLDKTHETTSLTLLQTALRDAFVDLDREILLVERGDLNIDYDTWMHSDQHKEHFTTDAFEENRMDEDDFEDPPHPHAAHNYKRVLHHSSERLVVKPDEDPGCTALVVMLTPQFIVCANAGDSRAVYSRSGHRAVALSYDHKPDDEVEKRRIYRAGGSVHGGRVEGDLAVSRGLGDYRFKDTDVVEVGTDCFYGLETDDSESSSNSSNATSQQKIKVDSMDMDKIEMKKLRSPDDHMVSPIPDMIVYTRDELNDEFIVLACDGIWDVQSNQECISTVAKIFQEGESNMGLLCEEVLDLCLKKGSKDNMTVIVIRLKAQTIGEGGGVEARRQLRLAAAESNNPNHQPGDY